MRIGEAKEDEATIKEGNIGQGQRKGRGKETEKEGEKEKGKEEEREKKKEIPIRMRVSSKMGASNRKAKSFKI